MAEKKRFITGTAAQAVYDYMLNEGIKPHAKTLAPIISAGDIGVVLVDPSAEAKRAALTWGWDGTAKVFRMTSGARKRMAKRMEEMGDMVAASWFSAKRNGRIFVLFEQATFLVNFDANGYGLEPGSNDFDGGGEDG
jgi:DNA primase